MFFTRLFLGERSLFLCNIIIFEISWGILGYSKIDRRLHKSHHFFLIDIKSHHHKDRHFDWSLFLVIDLTRYPQSSWATLFFSIYLAQRIVRNYLSVPTWIVRNWPPVPLVWLSFRGRITCCWYIVLVMKEGLEFRDCRVWWKVPMFLGLQAGKSSQWRIYRVFLFSIYFKYRLKISFFFRFGRVLESVPGAMANYLLEGKQA